jgi:L-aspartate oxidase
LYASLNIPKDKKVLILAKNQPWDSNSFLAQGGISVATDNDDIQAHFEDTIKAGAYFCNEDAVKIMVSDGISIIEDLVSIGLKFDKDEEGNLLYTKEGAHSKNRVLHLGGDATGRYIHSFLLKKTPHQILDDIIVTDILIENEKAKGLTIFQNGNLKNLYSKNIILASGGVGDIYKYSTNSKAVSGDIQGIALEKGIELENMEMLQFHPTAVITKYNEVKLLSEALRGEGAYIVDDRGERFLFKFDKRGELASRDIVSQAILKHNRKTFLSISHFDKNWFSARFPTIAKFLEGRGFKLTTDLIPISPAFHYTIGGIKTDINGKVPKIENLYAVGEVASTGVHGANRLASNSLLEALVFSKRAVQNSLSENQQDKFEEMPIKKDEIFKNNDEILKSELQNLMWKYISIERNEKDMKKALVRISEIENLEIGRMLKLQILTAKKIIQSAIENRTSKGVHLRTDIKE